MQVLTLQGGLTGPLELLWLGAHLHITSSCSCAHPTTAGMLNTQLAWLSCTTRQMAPCTRHLRTRHAPMQAVAYCSRECQAKHWKEGGHNAECGRLVGQAS